MHTFILVFLLLNSLLVCASNMSEIHPEIPPKLKNFSIFFSFNELIGTEEQSISFLQEIKLIPSKNSEPPVCKSCGKKMRVESNSQKKLGWIWRCPKPCRKSINPLTNTFFDASHCRIKINEVLAIIICFVWKMPVNQVIAQSQQWRNENDGAVVSNSTIVDYYSYCREICEVVASHSDVQLGGEDKTVEMDETFLTNRKYNRGRITEQMTIVVFGMYCKEDKTGLFFRVNSKKKEDLWPYIKRYVKSDTSRICTDGGKQYHNVAAMFSSKTVHLKTNHSVGQFVEKGNAVNTINHQENENKLLKKTILCRRSPKLLHQYMAVYFYRKHILEKKYKNHPGSQIFQFLLDIQKVGI